MVGELISWKKYSNSYLLLQCKTSPSGSVRSGNYLYRLLDEVSPSGSWKTLHGVVKRSLKIKEMITSIKKDESAARLFLVIPC